MVKLVIVNTGLSYEVRRSDGYVLCSKPTRRLAEERLHELEQLANS